MSASTDRHALESRCLAASPDRAAFELLFQKLDQEADYPGLAVWLERALTHWPADTAFLLQRSHVAIVHGDTQTAFECLGRVLETEPANVAAICELVRRGQGAQVGGLPRIEALLEAKATDTPEYLRLIYAKANLLEQHKRFPEAFAEFQRACALGASRGGMDMAAKSRAATMVIRDMQPARLDPLSGRGSQSEQPIFIVGMPRSGTSLTEQILAAHPAVFPGGEQMALGEVLTGLVRRANPRGQTMVEAIDALDVDIWQQAGAEYLTRSGGHTPEHSRVTDKLPANFGLLPFIRLMLPKARILHLRRDPQATLSSCIRKEFGSPEYALDLEDWARFYGVYEAFMSAWEPLLGDQMLTVDYEDLVTDLPATARRIIDFVGLDWHDACLHPERNSHAVLTASTLQVREPVHDRAVGAWRVYASEMAAIAPQIAETREAILAGAVP